MDIKNCWKQQIKHSQQLQTDLKLWLTVKILKIYGQKRLTI